MSRFVVILESYFNNLVEKRFEHKKEYNTNASQIIERLVWHKCLAFATALFCEYGDREQGKLENYFKKFSIEHTVNEEFYYHKSLQLYKLFVDNNIPFYPLKGPFWTSIIWRQKNTGDSAEKYLEPELPDRAVLFQMEFAEKPVCVFNSSDRGVLNNAAF